jgi:hypothetical protein
MPRSSLDRRKLVGGCFAIMACATPKAETVGQWRVTINKYQSVLRSYSFGGVPLPGVLGFAGDAIRAQAWGRGRINFAWRSCDGAGRFECGGLSWRPALREC